MTRAAAEGTLTVEVRFFAVLRDLAGSERWELELPSGATVADLLARLGEEIPGLPGGLAVAVGLEYAGPGRVLETGDEVALIPPVSGG